MLFDFGNSSYTTVIVTAVFAPYFINTVVIADEGSTASGNFYWGVGNAISQALVLLTAPIVGAVADFSGVKKRFLFLTYVGCVAGTCALSWVGPGDLALALVIFALSNFFFSSGENLIAAFLPEIAPPERMGLISGLGWGLGYVGGLVSLVACYPLVQGGFGADNAASVQWTFVIAGGFFLLSGLPTFVFLRERPAYQRRRIHLMTGFQRVFQTLRHVRKHRQLFRFLGIFLFYNCGTMIVITFASIFAARELGMSGGEVVEFFIVVQVSASVGALGFGYAQDRLGAKACLIAALVGWVMVCIGGPLCETTLHLYIVGNLAGVAMGASQSGARALVGLFTPTARSGEYFGLWGLAWKLSSGLGPLLFGIASGLGLPMRLAFLLTGVFFVGGIVGLFAVDVAAGRREAEATVHPS